jgi:anion-transporting  ArsA/GET3 family ATPase
MSLLTKRLLMVTGKGGAGKSTVSAALGLACAARGRRTVLAEMGEQQRMARLFGLDSGNGREPWPVAPNLETLSIDAQHALERELSAGLPLRAIAGRLVETRAVAAVAQAAPGLRELLALSVVRDLLRGHHDTVVLDGPATGHAIGLLEVPRTLAGIARVGPVRQRADSLIRMLEDPRQTAVVLVSTAEELAVSETLEAWERLAATRVACAGTVANAVLPPLFEPGDEAALGAVADDAGPTARAAVAAARERISRTAAERALLGRLPALLAELPMLPTDEPAGRAEATELAMLLDDL